MVPYMSSIQERLTERTELVKENMKKAQGTQKNGMTSMQQIGVLKWVKGFRPAPSVH